MIPLEDARRIAESFLDANVRMNFGHEIVIIESVVNDDGMRWTFPYNGKGWIESGDLSQAMAGNVPVFVDKETGEVDFIR